MGSVADHNLLRWNDFQSQIAANLQDLREAQRARALAIRNVHCLKKFFDVSSL